MNSNTLRTLYYHYPFIKGKSSVKNFIKPFLRKIEPIQIEPGLKLDIAGNLRIFWAYEEVEAALQFYINYHFPLNGTMIDCGAYTGILGFLAWKRKNASVTFIEPTSSAEFIINTMSLNATGKQCQLIQKACSLGKLDPRFKDVETITLEDIIRDYNGKVDLIKVDVDGPDYEVLQSMGDYLNPENVKNIYIEISPSNVDAIKFIQQKGYEIFAARKLVANEIKRLKRPLAAPDCFAHIQKGFLGNFRTENIFCIGKEEPLAEYLKKSCLKFEQVYWR